MVHWLTAMCCFLVDILHIGRCRPTRYSTRTSTAGQALNLFVSGLVIRHVSLLSHNVILSLTLYGSTEQ